MLGAQVEALFEFCKVLKVPLPSQVWHSLVFGLLRLSHDFSNNFQALENPGAVECHLNLNSKVRTFSCTKLVQTNFEKSQKVH